MTSGVRPLSGVRILAIEQMLALPHATQLLGFLSADVVEVSELESAGVVGASVPAAGTV